MNGKATAHRGVVSSCFVAALMLAVVVPTSGQSAGAPANRAVYLEKEIANDHLDLLDYLIARARERGIYMLFSPIQLYGSNTVGHGVLLPQGFPGSPPGAAGAAAAVAPA